MTTTTRNPAGSAKAAAVLALAAAGEILRKLPAGNTIETRAALAAVADAAQAIKCAAEAGRAALEAEYEAGRLARCEARSLPRAQAARATVQAAQRCSTEAAAAQRATARAAQGIKRAGLELGAIDRAAQAADKLAEEASAWQDAIADITDRSSDPAVTLGAYAAE